MKTVYLWLQEVTPDKLIPAFIIGEKTLYWYQERLWSMIRHDSASETAVEAFRIGCEKGKLTQPKSPDDTFDAMYERDSALVSKRLACDGKMYVEIGEPGYCLGFGANNPPRLYVFVAHQSDGIRVDFNALEKDLMDKYIRITEAVTQGKLVVTRCDEIQVLFPDAVRLPNAVDLTK